MIWALVVLYFQPVIHSVFILFLRLVGQSALSNAVSHTHLFVLNDLVFRTWNTINVIPVNVVILSGIREVDRLVVRTSSLVKVSIGLIAFVCRLKYLVRSYLLQTNQVLIG